MKASIVCSNSLGTCSTMPEEAPGGRAMPDSKSCADSMSSAETEEPELECSPLPSTGSWPIGVRLTWTSAPSSIVLSMFIKASSASPSSNISLSERADACEGFFFEDALLPPFLLLFFVFS